MIAEVEHPVFGRMEITNTPFVFSETPREVQGPAPLVGQHNATILSTHLGYSPAEIARLTKAGILVEEEKVKELAGENAA